jgi:hypothetical protein
MMKSMTRFSVWAAFAALLCFATGAFGQSTANTMAANTGHNFLNSTPANFLVFTLGFGSGPGQGNHGGSGCSQGSDNGGWGGRGGNGGGGCTTVPEGGTTLMYVLLAGVGCLGGMTLRSRRKAALREIK